MALTDEEQAQLDALLARQAEAAEHEEAAGDVTDAAVQLAEAAADMAEASAEVVAAEPDDEPAELVIEQPTEEELVTAATAPAIAEAIVIEAQAQAQADVIDAQTDAQIRLMEAEAALHEDPEPVPVIVADDEPPQSGSRFLDFFFGKHR